MIVKDIYVYFNQALLIVLHIHIFQRFTKLKQKNVYIEDEGFVECLVGTCFVGAKHFTAKAPLAKQNGFPG